MSETKLFHRRTAEAMSSEFYSDSGRDLHGVQHWMEVLGIGPQADRIRALAEAITTDRTALPRRQMEMIAALISTLADSHN